MSSSWISTLPPAPDVARALGLTVKRRMMGPCPACAATARSGKDNRPPLGMTGNGKGWRCHACSRTGGAVDLVAWRLFHDELGKGDPRWSELQTWCSDHGLLGQPGKVVALPPPSRPPPAEVTALWDASLPLSQAAAEAKPGPSTRESLRFLAERDLAPHELDDVARLLPDPKAFDYPAWWPRTWAATWRLVTRAYTAQGTVVSLHARAVRRIDDGAPKTRWPIDYEARGLVFANGRGVELLRGERPQLEGVLLVEGLTDLLAVSRLVTRARLPLAVLGGTSGSWSALETVPFPDHVPILVGVDTDPQGDKYATEIAAAVRPRQVRRLRIEEVARATG